MDTLQNYIPAKPRFPLFWHELVKLVHGLDVEPLIANGDGREVQIVDWEGRGLDCRLHRLQLRNWLKIMVDYYRLLHIITD